MSYTNSDVIHAWANWNPLAPVQFRRSNNGNCSFDGRYLYSYRTCIACHVSTQNERKGRVVFITTRSYSVTTSGNHMPGAHSIPAGAAVFYVDNVLADSPAEHKANLAAKLKNIETEVKRLSRARIYTSTDRLAEMVADAESYRLAFLRAHVRKPVTMPGPDFLAKIAERDRKARVTEQRRRARYAKERAKREAAEAAAYAERLGQWLAGEPVHLHYRRDTPVQFRVIQIDGAHVVESTMGARVPLADALQVAHLAEHCALNRHNYTPRLSGVPAVRVGDFQLTSVDSDGNVTVGCHRFTLAEIRRAQEAAAPILAGIETPAGAAAE